LAAVLSERSPLGFVEEEEEESGEVLGEYIEGEASC
jgi:hypothetical protein